MNNESLDPVLDKAKRILAERERKATCIEAGICPICGDKVLSDSDGGLKIYKCKKHGVVHAESSGYL